MLRKVKEALFNRRTEKQAELYLAEQEAIQNAYVRCFSSVDGQVVLDHLIQRYLTVPIASKGDDLLDIGEKQGRANLVNEITQRLIRG